MFCLQICVMRVSGPAYIDVCMYVLSVPGPLELELQTGVSRHVDAGNRIQVLWKSSS